MVPLFHDPHQSQTSTPARTGGLSDGLAAPYVFFYKKEDFFPFLWSIVHVNLAVVPRNNKTRTPQTVVPPNLQVLLQQEGVRAIQQNSFKSFNISRAIYFP